MGKLTAEQKLREYNRGRKAAREGRSRSSSEPWAYPFESDQHYEERREAFNQGYGHDGFRLLARRGAERVRLFTRNGRDWTERFPLIVEGNSRVRKPTIIKIRRAHVALEEKETWLRRPPEAMIGRRLSQDEAKQLLAKVRVSPRSPI